MPSQKKKKKAKKRAAKDRTKATEAVDFEITTESAKKLDEKAKEEIPFLRAKKGNANDPANPLSNLRIPRYRRQ